MASTLHFGPAPNQNAFQTSTFSKNNPAGYHSAFHKYEMIWDENGIKFLVGYVPAGEGFWKRGGFQGQNIYASGTKMAPFDEEVRISLEYKMTWPNFNL